MANINLSQDDLEALMARALQTALSAQNNPATTPERFMELLGKRMAEFHYNAEEHKIFEEYFDRYSDLFAEDAKILPDDAKVRLLLSKLGQVEYDKYKRHILPKKPKEIEFEDTVSILKKIFGPVRSLFSLRYQALKIQYQSSNDLITHSGLISQGKVLN
uniref:DUF7083 domain-containing protein n=1 Tax=Acrobeloides nanus TaxID=290746 RepID=A0A914CX76_9BILA